MSNDVFKHHILRPFSQRVNYLRDKAERINEILDRPAPFDQYPGRVIPTCFSKLYGPFGPVTARRSSEAGQESLATLATPADYSLPRNGNILVGQQGSFRLIEMAATSYMSLTYSADPGLAGDQRVFTQFGDIYDTVIDNNGGAILFNARDFVPTNPASTGSQASNISFDIGLYDKLRGRQLHDGKSLPINIFSGQNFATRRVPEHIRFDTNTELEPRLFINEIRIARDPETDQAFNAMELKVFIYVTFKGVLEQA
jgi:hypothetical protein